MYKFFAQQAVSVPNIRLFFIPDYECQSMCIIASVFSHTFYLKVRFDGFHTSASIDFMQWSFEKFIVLFYTE